jgi:spectinomycin phosphotransferase
MEKELEVEKIVNRTIVLGKKLQGKNQEFVLCHADIHTANLLVTPDDKIHVVDWDGLIMAPKERDLMFICSATGEEPVNESREEKLFFQGYGKTHIEPLALAYYRYEWVVQEIGDFGERVFFLEGVGEKTRAASVRGFKQLFQAGDVVEQAYRSEEGFCSKEVNCSVYILHHFESGCIMIKKIKLL